MNRIDPAHAGRSGGVHRIVTRLGRGLALCLLAFTGAALAQTEVGGVVSSDTIWTADQSPYVVVGDVTVVSGAVLKLDPGIEVRVGSGVDITIVDGSLVAIGLNDNRILITSHLDAGDPPANPPQPGDWGALRFLGGTAAGAILENVDIRYGQGIHIEAASPTLRNVAIEHHDGAAIELDLLSSPQGYGLSAAGNGLNGIRVPAGQINDDVVWALTGIPYVVQDGMVAIGGAVFGFTPNRLNLALNASAVLELALPDAAPGPDGISVDIESLAPDIVGLISGSPVHFAPGQTTAQVTIEALSVVPQQVELRARHPDYPAQPDATARIRVVHLPALLLAPEALEIEVNATASLTISIPNPAPAAGLPVALSTDCPDCLDPLPAVTIPAGQTSASFNVRGNETGIATLIAVAEGHVPTQASIQVRQPFIQMPLSFIVPPSGSRELQFTLSSPPSSDIQVNFIADPDDVVSPVGPVTVLSGQTDGVIQIVAAAAEASTVLTAQADGYEASATSIDVRDYQLAIQDGIPILPQGFEHSVRVQLNQPAPAGGLEVQLDTDPSSVVQFLAESVLIPENQTESLPIPVVGMAPGEATLTATAAGVNSALHALTVVGPLRVQFSKEHVYLAPGLRSHQNELSVQLVYGPAQAPTTFTAPRPVPIQFHNEEPESFLAPGEIVLGQGWSQAYPRLQGLQLSAGPLTLTASSVDAAAQAASIQVHVVEPELIFDGLAGHRLTTSPRDAFTLRWQVPGASFPAEQVASVQIDVGVHDPIPANIVDGIYSSLTGGSTISWVQFPTGSTQSATAYVGVPDPNSVEGGSYRVSAQAPGHPVVYSALQQVDQRALRLDMSGSSNELGAGLQYQCRIRLYRTRGGQPYGTGNLTVGIVSSDPAKIPSTTVNFGAGVTNVCVPTEVPGPNSTDPVTLTAQEIGSSGYQASTPLEIIVGELHLGISGLSTYRPLDSEEDPFWVRVCGAEDGFYNCSGSLIQPLNVGLALVETTEPAPVQLLHIGDPAQPVTSIQIPAADFQSPDLYVGRAVAVGDYRIQASSPGNAVAVESELQHVRIPQLHVGYSTSYVGRRMLSESLTIRPYLGDQSMSVCELPLPGLQVQVSNSELLAVHDVTDILCTSPSEGGRGIGGGQGIGYVTLKGLALSDPSAPIEITATAADFESGPPMLMHVVEPLIRFDISERQWTDQGRNGFSLRALVPLPDDYPYPGYDYYSAVPDEEHLFDLEFVDRDPADVVTTFYDDELDGSPITTTQLSQGLWTAYVETPTLPPGVTAGSYRIRATNPHFAPALSNQILVENLPKILQGESALRFSRLNVHVGVGLRTHPDELRLELDRAGLGSAHQGAIELRLRCASEQICRVPPVLSLAPGEHSIAVPVQGLASGSTMILVETATPEMSSRVQVSVREPTLKIRRVELQGNGGLMTPGLVVHPFVSGATYPRQHVSEEWFVNLRSESPLLGLSSARAHLRPGDSESAPILLEYHQALKTRVFASRAGIGIAEIELVGGAQ